MSQPIDGNGRPMPRRTPISAPYFDAAKAHRLILPRCPRDGFFFYPRNRCPQCLSDDWAWEEASGRGTLHAFAVDRVGHDPAQRSRLPLVVAAVDLEEGPRLTTDLVDCAPEDVRIGMPVEATFEDLDGETLVLFKPSARSPTEATSSGRGASRSSRE
ncbi:MAG: Zn-ribbon domain-containing OB-fold protein [bacterium]